MTFILGSSKLTYDHFGNWTRRLDGHVSAPDVIIGDPSWPGSMILGTFMLCGELSDSVYVTVKTTPEA